MKKPKNISESTGVYFFLDKNKKPIYIGKAKNLKNRVNSYFTNKLGAKTQALISESNSMKFIKVESEFEALLLEANLIKKYKPKYNISLKDDKSPLYIGITKDEYPIVLFLRETNLKKYNLKYTFGPYLNSFSVKNTLKNIRKITPYSTHKIGSKPCIYSQIGLCYPCPNFVCSLQEKDQLIFKKEYLKNIKLLTKILSGKLTLVQKELLKEIKNLSNLEKYEEANLLKKRLENLEYLIKNKNPQIETYELNPNLIDDKRQDEIDELKQIINKFIKINKLERIECFDIAHLSGNFPTASMVTFINGNSEKKYYRHFKVSNTKQNNDVLSMQKIIKRRLIHLNDWGIPDLVIIDGGKPQLSKVYDEFAKHEIPVIALAKKYETLIFYTNNKFEEYKLPNSQAKNLVQRIRDEAHRFSRRYHHHLLKTSLLKK